MVDSSLQSKICDKLIFYFLEYVLFYVGISKEPVHSCVYFTQIHSISREKMGTYGAIMMILF